MKEMSPCDVESLKTCLEENQGQAEKCREHITAFQNTCSRFPGTTPTPASSSSRTSFARDEISPSSPIGKHWLISFLPAMWITEPGLCNSS
ncbi:hypothetical protein Mapa_008192 [Marchantia paleacea]|nr:hypothetical protein Mapa_008192 [Marchantia paleacea]